MGITIRLNLLENKDTLNIVVLNDGEENHNYCEEAGAIANFNISFTKTSNAANIPVERKSSESLASNLKCLREYDSSLADLTDEAPGECQSTSHNPTGYFVVEKILGNRFNCHTKKHEFLLSLKNCASVDASWNPPQDSVSYDFCDPDNVLYVQKSNDFVIPYQYESNSYPCKSSYDLYDSNQDSHGPSQDQPEPSEDCLIHESPKQLDLVNSSVIEGNVLSEEIEEKPQGNLIKSSVVSEDKKIFNEIFAPSNASECKCQYCGLWFKTRISLKKHFIKCNTRKSEMFSCSQCPRVFSCEYFLNQHLKIHSKSEIHRCKMCGYAYCNNHLLKQHEKKIHCLRYQRRRSHFIKRMPPIRNREKPHFECKICDRTFTDEETLNSHTCVTPEAGMFTCTRSNELFLTEKSSEEHKLSHSELQCCICGKAFRSISHLEFHEQSHRAKDRVSPTSTSSVASVSNISMFPSCSQCFKRFKTKAAVLVHESTIHSNYVGSLLKCLECGKLLKTKACLTTHMFLHTNEKRHECKFCDYKCIQKNALNSHMLFKHGYRNEVRTRRGKSTL